MRSISQDMKELRRQLAKGAIQQAYRALLSYMMDLRTRLAGRYGRRAVSGLYQGYLDMTYFAVVPPALQRRGLKVAIVFNYEAFGFEAWLAARNRKVQRQYWELLKDGDWAPCRVVAPAEGVDAMVACDLAEAFDPGEAEALTGRIEAGTAAFIEKVERFLAAPKVR